MSVSQTPGPWFASGDTVYRTPQRNGVVADCDVGSASRAEREAIARVIAAAPEMLGTLEVLLEQYSSEWPEWMRHSVSSVIAKAKKEPSA